MAETTNISWLLFVILFLTLTAGAYPEDVNKVEIRDDLRGFHKDIHRGLLDSSAWENEVGKPVIGLQTNFDELASIVSGGECNETSDDGMLCTGKGMETVPQDLNKNITRFTFKETGIKSLPDGIFENYTSLETIVFFRDRLSEISKGAFRGLSNLTFLYLDNNRLVDTSFGDETFEGLSSLEKCYIYSNNLTRLPTHVIENATNLKDLRMFNSSISEMGPDSYPTLMGLRNLEILGLSRNKLSKVPTQALNLLPSLKQLDLSENNITVLNSSDLEGAFADRLESLNLNYNNLKITTSAFVHLQKLKELSLVNCNLTSLNGVDFMYKPHLETLSIYLNHFKCDCHIAWMAEAVQQGKVWAKKWKTISYPPKCGTPKWMNFKNISDLYPQDLTCSPPYIEARTPTYVTMPQPAYFDFQAVMRGGYPYSTWVLPDGTTRSGRWVGYMVSGANDTIINSDHSVITTLSGIGTGLTGVVNFTLVASNVGGDSNLTFWLDLTGGASGAGSSVCSPTILSVLISVIAIMGRRNW